MTEKRRVLIDTDTASDDAVALIMALRSPAIEVLAITVVAGNVHLDQAVSNALFTVELCGASTPVFPGAEKPILRTLEIADWFHGKDGLGDHGYMPAVRKPEPRHAVLALIEIIQSNPGIEIITLGPLTNLATALLLNPDIARNVSRCVIMGGAPCCEGNVTPAAEFNIWADPEAARIVFRSQLPIEMVGWQLCRGDAVLNHTDIARILALHSPFGDFAIRCNRTAEQALLRQTGENGISQPDPVAMAILLRPELCLQSSAHYIEIETATELTRGMTVVDRLNVSADPRNRATWANALISRKAHVCWKLDVPGWKSVLADSLTSTA